MAEINDGRKGTEYSCGAVVFRETEDGPVYLIICSLEGYYGFPKGHVEAGETELQAAAREIWEETGLNPEFIPGFRYEEEHILPKKPGIIKNCAYFIAKCQEGEPAPQPEELVSAEFMTMERALELFQFENSKDILKAADEFIRKL